MLTCYIIDDEHHAIKSLQGYIEKTPWLRLLGSEENPVQAVAIFHDNGTYADITFVDIDMPHLSGIEIAALIGEKTCIVFTTAHPNFALQAFELGIRDYLLKPYSYDRFIRCVSKLRDASTPLKAKSPEATDDFFYIQVEGKGKLVKLFYKDILFIESQKNYLSIMTRERKYLTYLTLTEIEEKLPASFIRVNKSQIIAADKISHIEGSEIFLTTLRESFPIGLAFRDNFTAHMKTHLIKSKRS